MQSASNKRTTAVIIAIMVIGIVSVLALSFFTGRYNSATTKADPGFTKWLGD